LFPNYRRVALVRIRVLAAAAAGKYGEWQPPKPPKLAVKTSQAVPQVLTSGPCHSTFRPIDSHGHGPDPSTSSAALSDAVVHSSTDLKASSASNGPDSSSRDDASPVPPLHEDTAPCRAALADFHTPPAKVRKVQTSMLSFFKRVGT
jgi:hypothetical protein